MILVNGVLSDRTVVFELGGKAVKTVGNDCELFFKTDNKW